MCVYALKYTVATSGAANGENNPCACLVQQQAPVSFSTSAGNRAFQERLRNVSGTSQERLTNIPGTFQSRWWWSLCQIRSNTFIVIFLKKKSVAAFCAKFKEIKHKLTWVFTDTIWRHRQNKINVVFSLWKTEKLKNLDSTPTGFSHKHRLNKTKVRAGLQFMTWAKVLTSI